MENLARLGGPLLLDLLGCEHVHRDSELVRSRVPRARAHHDVHRREPDRLRVQREVLAGGLRLTHRDTQNLRHVAEQPGTHRVRAGRHTADLVLPLLVGGGARPDRLDADAHPRQRRAGRVGHAAADRPALRGESTRGRDQYQDGAGDDTDDPSHRRSFLFRGGTAATNPHAARYTAGSGGRQGRWGGAKKPPSGGARSAARSRCGALRAAVVGQTAGGTLVDGNRHRPVDLVAGDAGGKRQQPAIASRVDPAVATLEQQRIDTLL